MTQLDLLELARRKPVHFMGIGGAGMCPLAELLLRSGGSVSGCDSHLNSAARRLTGMGVEIADHHDPSHVLDCGALVVTSAVPADHPEIRAARDAGIPVLKRAAALGAIVNPGTVVGVAGTHGKTSTTALTTAALAAAGMDPTGLVGGHVPAWGGNLRFGSDRLFVVEADEYDRSFLTLRPTVAIVTTLEADHLDIYGSLQGVEDAFLEYLGQTADDGIVIASSDDAGVGRLIARLQPDIAVITYGTAAGSMLRASDVKMHGRETQFTVSRGGSELGTVQLKLPGLHNVRNALAAIGAALHLGADWRGIVAGLAEYTGVSRRFERIGEAEGVLIYDDYGHHPTEIRATLAAARRAFPDRRLVAVFQPHLFTRTRDFADEFGAALASADLVFVTDIYPAREQPIAGVTGELVADAARSYGADVRYIESRTELPGHLIESLTAGDLCLTLGAGDLDQAARDIHDALTAAGHSETNAGD